MFDYDERDNVVRASDPEDKVTQYGYNPDGTMTSITDPRGNGTSFPQYDPSGQPTVVVDAETHTTRFGYDADGFLRWVQDANHESDSGAEPREFRTYFDYDTWHRMGRQSTPHSTRNRRGELVWSAVDFDANDNVLLSIAPHFGRQYPATGARTNATFDAMDRQKLVTGPDREKGDETWKLDYDGRGGCTR